MSCRPSEPVEARKLAVLLLAVASIASACAHFTPYYREGQRREVAPADANEIDHRLLLIGDAGDPASDGEPVLALLAQQVRQMPERTTVVFLGDNAYERGMPEAPKTEEEEDADKAKEVVDAILVDLFASRREAERAINAQIDVVRGTDARAIFIPGNHDWDQFEDAGGWNRILEQGRFIDAAGGDGTDVRMLPRGGCPGPVPVQLGSRGHLLALDTQWWLETRVDGKPVPDRNPTHCEYTTEKDVRQAIVTELAAAADQQRWSIVVGHHPLETEGPHGGFVDPLAHLFPFRVVRHYVPFYVTWFPLPVIGSAVVGLRSCCSPSAQDVANGRNLHMRNALGFSFLEAEKRDAAPLAYAAGHDHSLQVFESPKGARYLLVSGLGSHTHASEVGSNRRTLFAHSNPAHAGFMQIDFLRHGGVRLGVIECGEAPQGAEVFSRELAPRGASPATAARLPREHQASGDISR